MVPEKHKFFRVKVGDFLLPLWDRPAAYQLVGRVMAYQGFDG